MIICDFSQTMRACVAAEIGFSKNVVVTEDLIRHMILNSLRANVARFKSEYGEVVLALDGRRYWRKDVFPYYKARRREAAKESPLDWATIHASLDKIKQEMREFMPYRVVEAEGAEADDVIGVLVRKHRESEKVLIMSRDRDFVQLHDPWSDDVKQWDPIKKTWVVEPDVGRYHRTKIIKGDAGDGIPNVRMPGDCLVNRVRQKPITAALLEQYMDELPRGVGEPEILANYERNAKLIDLVNTPPPVQEAILDSYESQPAKGRDRILGYFMSRRLRNLTEAIGDF